MIVLIWSFEHNAWWGPGEVGYVEHSKDAGRYSLAEGIRIVERANRVAINEAMVFLPRSGSFPDDLPARPTGVRGGRR